MITFFAPFGDGLTREWEPMCDSKSLLNLAQWAFNSVMRRTHLFFAFSSAIAFHSLAPLVFSVPRRHRRVLVCGDVSLSGGTFVYLKMLVGLLLSLDQDITISAEANANYGKLQDFASDNNVKLLLRPSFPSFASFLFLAFHILLARPWKIIVSASVPGMHTYSLLFGIPSVHIYHSAPSSSLDREMRALIRRYFGDRDKIIAVSEHMRHAIIEKYGLRPRSHGQIFKVTSGVEDRRMHSKSARRSDKTVLTLGHVVHYKNVETWLKTAEYVTSHANPGMKVRFIWAGDGPELFSWRKVVSARDDISFVGFQAQPEKFLDVADIYYQPSLLESFGLAVAEAMSFGIPCIVSSCGGLPEIVVDGLSGIVLPAKDSLSHGNAILRILEDEKYRQRLSKAARERYETNFTIQAWRKAFCAVALGQDYKALKSVR